MEFPDDLRYSEEHEWVRAGGATTTVGITAYAQDSLGDVVYISLPEVGARVTAGEPCAEVESTKAVSEIYAPLSGTVAAVNEALADRPELVNSDPYGEGWIFTVDVVDETEIDGLLSAQAYRDLVENA